MECARLQVLALCLSIISCVMLSVCILSPDWALFHTQDPATFGSIVTNYAGPILMCSQNSYNNGPVICHIIDWNELDQMNLANDDFTWFKAARSMLGLSVVLSFSAFMLHMASLCARFSRLIPHGVLNILTGLFGIIGFSIVRGKLTEINDTFGVDGHCVVFGEWSLYNFLGFSVLSFGNGIVCFAARKTARNENPPSYTMSHAVSQQPIYAINYGATYPMAAAVEQSKPIYDYQAVA